MFSCKSLFEETSFLVVGDIKRQCHPDSSCVLTIALGTGHKMRSSYADLQFILIIGNVCRNTSCSAIKGEQDSYFCAIHNESF